MEFSQQFDLLADVLLLQGLNHQHPSALHGVMSGVLCGGGKPDSERLLALYARYMESEEGLSGRLGELLVEIYQQTAVALADDELTFDLILPDEENDLSQRSDALSQWCQGFLIGFGTAARKLDESAFSEDVRDALEDVSNIAALESDQDEQDEAAYMEVNEYLRVISMVIFAELVIGKNKQAPVNDEVTGEKPTLH